MKFTKKPKLKLYGGGGLPISMPVKGSDEYNNFLEWIRNNGTVLNPEDPSNYEAYIASKRDQGSYAIGGETAIPTVKDRTPLQKLEQKPINIPPTAPITPNLKNNLITPEPIKKQFDWKKAHKYIEPTLIGLDLGMKYLDQQQLYRQAQETQRQLGQPDTHLYEGMSGDNRNLANLTENDTALTAHGAVMSGNIPVQYEKGEKIHSDGFTYDADTDMTHEQMDSSTPNDMLATGDAVISNQLKVSQILSPEITSNIFNIRAKKQHTFADIDNLLDKKYDVKDNQRVLEDKKWGYNKMAIDTAMLKQEQANKAKQVLLGMQQTLNKNSNGVVASHGTYLADTEHDLSMAEIKRLEKLGYKLEY